VETAFGWETAAGPGRSISVFGHGGALLFYTTLLTYLWFRRQGTFRPAHSYQARRVIARTVRGSVKSTISIVTLVAMALTMQHAGMTQLLALALSTNTGSFYPFLSPFVGALGAVVTGSNTNSNVLFGLLQKETAASLHISATTILAAQTAGGALGSVFAPAKVVVGVSTVAGSNDSQVLRLVTIAGMTILIVLGIIAWLFA
jgi:lactate permease